MDLIYHMYFISQDIGLTKRYCQFYFKRYNGNTIEYGWPKPLAIVAWSKNVTNNKPIIRAFVTLYGETRIEAARPS